MTEMKKLFATFLCLFLIFSNTFAARVKDDDEDIMTDISNSCRNNSGHTFVITLSNGMTDSKLIIFHRDKFNVLSRITGVNNSADDLPAVCTLDLLMFPPSLRLSDKVFILVTVKLSELEHLNLSKCERLITEEPSGYKFDLCPSETFTRYDVKVLGFVSDLHLHVSLTLDNFYGSLEMTLTSASRSLFKECEVGRKKCVADNVNFCIDEMFECDGTITTDKLEKYYNRQHENSQYSSFLWAPILGYLLFLILGVSIYIAVQVILINVPSPPKNYFVFSEEEEEANKLVLDTMSRPPEETNGPHHRQSHHKSLYSDTEIMNQLKLSTSRSTSRGWLLGSPRDENDEEN